MKTGARTSRLALPVFLIDFIYGAAGDVPVTAYVVKFIRKNYLMQNYYELSLSAIPKSEYFFSRAGTGGNQK